VFDLSAAFDVIYRLLLLKRLYVFLDIKKNILTCVKSYMDRNHSVFVTDKISPAEGIHLSVPQVSVYEPMNYCMYTQPVSQSVKRHIIKCHCYGDDTQVYITLNS